MLELPGNEIWAIEIKRGGSPTLDRGFWNARDDLQPTRSFIVYSGNERYSKGDGIEAIGVHELAQELASVT